MSSSFKVKIKTKKKVYKYKIRKSVFWFVLLILPLFAVFSFKSCHTPESPRLIRAAICGAVNHNAVFTLREGADLSILIRLANGLKPLADVHRIDFNHTVQNDSVYHIPQLFGRENKAIRANLFDSLHRAEDVSFNTFSNSLTAKSINQDVKVYTVLYVGQPAVFVLINYYPDFNRINFVHIPHSTVFLNNDYRLIDMFFSLDIRPTMRIVANKLKQHIDYYLIQDRFGFIDLIDVLGGVDVKLDEEYAREYNFKPGWNKLDGFHAWEYIRFMDWKNLQMTVKRDRKIDLISKDNFQIDANKLEYVYEVRNQRQRYVLQGMRKAFVGLPVNKQLDVITHFEEVFQTDMDISFLNELYKDILETKDFSFGSLPGYYSNEKNNLYFYPDLPGFEMLRQQEIRRNLEKKQRSGQTVY